MDAVDRLREVDVVGTPIRDLEVLPLAFIVDSEGRCVDRLKIHEALAIGAHIEEVGTGRNGLRAGLLTARVDDVELKILFRADGEAGQNRVELVIRSRIAIGTDMAGSIAVRRPEDFETT